MDIDLEHRTIEEYGKEGAKRIFELAFTRAQYGDYPSALRWATREYEYEQASEDHGCGFVHADARFDFDDPAEAKSGTITLGEWLGLDR
jgi:hypothetical protein